MLVDRYLDIDVGPLPFYRTRLRTNALLHPRPTRRLKVSYLRGEDHELDSL